MDANKTENYIPHLDSLLHGYNNSTHSTIGISPNVAWNDKSTHPQMIFIDFFCFFCVLKYQYDIPAICVMGE